MTLRIIKSIIVAFTLFSHDYALATTKVSSQIPLNVKSIYIGAGDTTVKLVNRNPYLEQFKLSKTEELRLSLMEDLDVHYDDGNIKLDIGCASTTNIDGNEHFFGAAFIGIKLCDQPLNDWKPALQRAAEVMRQLKQQNPKILNLRDFYLRASDSELLKIGGAIWQKSTDDLDVLRTLEEADAKFAQEAANGNQEVVSGNRRSTYAFIGVYASESVIFSIGVSKTANFGGADLAKEVRESMGIVLTEEQRRVMRYETTISFRLRNDRYPGTVNR